jgi:hypothetical protein
MHRKVGHVTVIYWCIRATHSEGSARIWVTHDPSRVRVFVGADAGWNFKIMITFILIAFGVGRHEEVKGDQCW